jgi:hypothetical protein
LSSELTLKTSWVLDTEAFWATNLFMETSWLRSGAKRTSLNFRSHPELFFKHTLPIATVLTCCSSTPPVCILTSTSLVLWKINKLFTMWWEVPESKIPTSKISRDFNLLLVIGSIGLTGLFDNVHQVKMSPGILRE